MHSPGHAGGLTASLTRFVATALDLAKVRLALLGTEFEHGTRQLFDGLLWGGLALMVLGMGIALFCGFLILMFWENHRLVAMGALSIGFLFAGALLIRKARDQLIHASGVFSLTTRELERDRASLLSGQDHGSP